MLLLFSFYHNFHIITHDAPTLEPVLLPATNRNNSSQRESEQASKRKTNLQHVKSAQGKQAIQLNHSYI